MGMSPSQLVAVRRIGLADNHGAWELPVELFYLTEDALQIWADLCQQDQLGEVPYFEPEGTWLIGCEDSSIEFFIFLKTEKPGRTELGVHSGGELGAYKFEHGQLLAWIINNPDLMKRTVTQTERVSKAARKRGKVASKASEVTVVELREAVKQQARDVEAAERTYRSRWIVRGHWTHQAYGPRHSLRRVQWVPPYVKGPAGAPLVVKEKVSKW